ncbi:cell cycle and apoptosis regulator protein 2 isoform X3 [Grus americana]|uniref:cell cycle and apoptosis regulator protein 2 isoform X3 n=1 Tax=Grus americana TaxID=9117 RepID=UPI0024082A30|nr:cell cycle and apoptosis regulator protein 2 isoform X3 [Grus americana]
MSPPGRGCIAGGRKTVVTSLQERLGGWMSSSSSSAVHPAASPETPAQLPPVPPLGSSRASLEPSAGSSLTASRRSFPGKLRCPGQGQEQERLGQMSQGSQLCVPTPRARGPLAGEPTQGEPHRPRGSSLPPAPSAMPGRCYGSIRLPHGFYHLCLRWLAPSPPHPPPHWQYPSHIPGADREEDAEATLDDADSAFRFVLYRRLQ